MTRFAVDPALMALAIVGMRRCSVVDSTVAEGIRRAHPPTIGGRPVKSWSGIRAGIWRASQPGTTGNAKRGEPV